MSMNCEEKTATASPTHTILDISDFDFQFVVGSFLLIWTVRHPNGAEQHFLFVVRLLGAEIEVFHERHYRSEPASVNLKNLF